MLVTGTEITFGFRALKAALGLAREVKDLTDATAIKAKVIELQALILDAQSNAIEAREAHASQVSRISELEAELSKMKSWEAERARYEIVNLGSGTFVFMLKDGHRGGQTAHWLCPNCFEDGFKSIFQRRSESYLNCVCYRCKAEIVPHIEQPTWGSSPTNS